MTVFWIGALSPSTWFLIAVLPVLLLTTLVVSLRLMGTWHRRDTEGWVPIGGGVLRLKITNGWLLRRGSAWAQPPALIFVPDPEHERPPERVAE